MKTSKKKEEKSLSILQHMGSAPLSLLTSIALP